MTSFPPVINARYEVGSESAGFVQVRDVLDDKLLMGRLLPKTRPAAGMLDFWTNTFHPLFQPVYRCLDLGSNVLVLMPTLEGWQTLDSLPVIRIKGPQLATIFQQLATALVFLHEQHLIHPRLDLAAVYVDENHRLQITGHEACLPWVSGPAHTLDARYAAPELMENHNRSHKSDVYHLGALFYHFLSGSIAPRDQPYVAITKKYRSIKKAWDDLLEGMLASDPEQRPSWSQINDRVAALSTITTPAKPVLPWIGIPDEKVIEKMTRALTLVSRGSRMLFLQTYPGRERNRRLLPFTCHATEQGFLVIHTWQREPETRRFKVINDLVHLLREGVVRYLDDPDRADLLQPLSELFPLAHVIEAWRRQLQRLTDVLVPHHFKGLLVIIEDVHNLGRDTVEVLVQLAGWMEGTKVLLVLGGRFLGHTNFRRLAAELPLPRGYLLPAPLPASAWLEEDGPSQVALAEIERQRLARAGWAESLVWYRLESHEVEGDGLARFLNQCWNQLEPSEQLILKVLSCSERAMQRRDLWDTFSVERLGPRLKFLMRAGLVVRSLDGGARVSLPLIADFCLQKTAEHDLALIRDLLLTHEQNLAGGGDPVQISFLRAQLQREPDDVVATQLQEAVFHRFELEWLWRLDLVYQQTRATRFRQYHLFAKILRGHCCNARSVSAFKRLTELAKAVRLRSKGDHASCLKACTAAAGRRHGAIGLRAYALVLAAEAAALAGEGAAVARAWRRFIGYESDLFAPKAYQEWLARLAAAMATAGIRREPFALSRLSPGLRSWVVACRAWCEQSFEAALEPGEAALQELCGHHDLYFRGRLYKLIGNIRFRNNQPQRATAAYISARTCFTATGDLAELAFVDFNLAGAENLAGRFVSSRRRFTSVYLRAQEAGDDETRCQAGYHLMVCSLFLNEEARFTSEYREHRRLATALATREEEIRGLALKLHQAAAAAPEEVAEDMVVLRALIRNAAVDPLLQDQARIALRVAAFVLGKPTEENQPYPELTRWRHQLLDFLSGRTAPAFDVLIAQRGGGYFGACHLYLLKSFIVAGYLPEKHLTPDLAKVYQDHAGRSHGSFGNFLRTCFKGSGSDKVPVAAWDQALGIMEKLDWRQTDVGNLRKRLLQALQTVWPFSLWGLCCQTGRGWKAVPLPDAAGLEADVAAHLKRIKIEENRGLWTFTIGDRSQTRDLLLLPVWLDSGEAGLMWFIQERTAAENITAFEPLLRFYAKLFEYALQGCKAPPPARVTRATDRDHGMVGAGGRLNQVREQINKYAPTDISIYIWGESGTGKELAARAFHRASPRCEQAFRAINCSHFPDNLVEAELFGHKRGAFTGANMDRVGLLELVDGGTLFLDEIGDINAKVQSLLLRVIQEGEFSRIGELQVRKVDIRFITATNKNIHDLIAAGIFRADLYFRLVGEEVQLPPLRERFEDLPLLATHFTRKYAPGRRMRFTRGFYEHLRGYHWPGNIRELESYIRKLLINWPEHETFTATECPPFLLPREDAAERAVTLEVFEERNRHRFIRDRLERYGGNKTQTAKSLGISRQQLTNLVAKYHLP